MLSPGAWRSKDRPPSPIPWFVIGFVLMAVARTIGVLPPWLPTPLRTVATMLTVLSMAALGLAVDVRAGLVHVAGPRHRLRHYRGAARRSCFG